MKNRIKKIEVILYGRNPKVRVHREGKRVREYFPQDSTFQTVASHVREMLIADVSPSEDGWGWEVTPKLHWTGAKFVDIRDAQGGK